MELVHSSSQTLATAAAEYWEKRLQGDPIEATLLGDRRFDDRMPDPSPEEETHPRGQRSAPP